MDFCGYPLKEEKISSPKDTMTEFINTREQLERQLDNKLQEVLKLIGEII